MDHKIENEYENITPFFERTVSEDQLFIRGKTNKYHNQHELKIKYFHNLETPKKSIDSDHMTLLSKGRLTTDEHFFNILRGSFDKVYPLFYLNSDQRKILEQKIIIQKFDQKVVLFSGMPNDYDPGDFACFILLQGEIHVFNNDNVFQDLITGVTFFGYDGPIFQKRLSTVKVEKNSVIGIIPRNFFLNLIKPFSKFATFISRNIRYKDKVLDDLQAFKNFILSSIDKGPIEIAKLLDLYKKINSCMHPKSHSEELDITAWVYALNRLPQSVFETYIYILINKSPKILCLSDELSYKLLPRVLTAARNRDIYKYLDGKNVIICRDMETDVLDFISNLCIHIIESTKIRKYITSPITLNKIHNARDHFDKTLSVLRSTTGLHFSKEESEMLKNHFGNNFSEKLINICINYQDTNITISKNTLHDKDEVENWVENLWNVTRDLLNLNSTVDEIDDLVVDIIQGSKKTLLSMISPHMFMHKDEIFQWAAKTNQELKTQKFHNESDKLIAYSYYYYRNFPEKDQERKKINKYYGIEVIEKTFSTGVQIIVVDVNKLHRDFVDPSLKLKPASKNHIILHIGYTFGAQSHQIIKPVLMLFGSKARSLNIIGKAGGLVGERTDILLASKIFYDKTHDVSEVNYGNVDVDDLKANTGCNIHIGPMLTVAGTILQNSDLLNFYKHVMGCVGLEMEGYYFAREIENCIKHDLLSESFITRCFYYASDLPLDPEQNLSKEEGNVSWDEGIGSMNAIQRYILKQIISE